jgi:glycosyltransferase involved in cell wall biosynthesis
MKKILFISHEATLTGAPMVLLHFMAWIKEHHPEVEVGVLLMKSGQLAERFHLLANKYYVYQYKKKSYINKLKRKINKLFFAKKPISDEAFFLNQIAYDNYDVIYANTVLSIETAVKIKSKSQSNTKLIAHIHELAVVLQSACVSKLAVSKIDHIIAVSNLVKSNLVNDWEDVNDKTTVVYECSKIDTELKKHEVNAKNTFIVGASGFVHWRKGCDVFIQVARYILKNFADVNIKFQWVGNVPPLEQMIITNDLKKLNLEKHVEFIGEKENPIPFFQLFDLFLMPSREDPFPLVCIEMGLLGIPIVCFEKATGTAEVLSNGGGKIIPYLDIESMAETIVFYYSNQEALDFDSQKAKEIFNNFTPEIICPQIYQLIENVIKHK